MYAKDFEEKSGDPKREMRFVEPIVSLEIQFPIIVSKQHVFGNGGINAGVGIHQRNSDAAKVHQYSKTDK